ncbi:1,4-dihydroxy-6-naphthoate synthase [Paenibacillus sp. V4I5]|uniref:1,4-dihydroxy-6-naphthoate synthase n=1 Tax=Paenibacillus sp. V4I5 TaxID=3042306 RepID=UPI00279379A4|nr:1,4-dihydroxy-6-naphthoate synthase [Paenibacillus sp. V4I5]MDQ0917060.1 hypothetical protein [Paenibacillus sp. V4I5]
MDLNNFFCKIFIDTDVQYEYLYQETSENEILDLSLIKNDDFDAIKRLDFPDGFLFSRYYLEVEPNEKFNPHSYVASISLLLECLWTKGFKAVAACDFEELLPRKGGYNYR